MEKEIYYFVRRLENAIINALNLSAKISQKAEPAFSEGIACLKEAKHHFSTAQIAEKE